ncbi:MAG: isoprenylcysteine carboxylmethyltransferase family protein [Candidatus Aminicenantes bacterium]|nr:MAG: isoprenylcysteine carboxylmethyltransferase family protein [Candidatus Aminicenantes bacterium]
MPKQGKKPMTFLGIGLKFAIISIIYSTLVLYSHSLWMSHLSIPIPRVFSQVFGILLMAIGIPIYLISGITIRKYFHEGKLATKGIYGYIRHPIYGSWILFIIPGIVLLINSLIGLTIPIFMYVLFKILIVKEDKYLEDKFGEEFFKYKKRVGEIFPRFWNIFRTS